MKKCFNIFILGTAIVWFLTPVYVFGQMPRLLESLPSIGPTPVYEGGDITNYFQWVFSFGISLAGIFAVLMIVIGGIEYVAAYGDPNRISSARNRINQALLGLLLAICAWLILYTINPNFIKGTFTIPSISKPISTQEALQRVRDQQTTSLSSQPSPTQPQTTPPSTPTTPIPQEDPCKGFICNTISRDVCTSQGGTILSPCETYCPSTKGLCGGTYVCCKR